MKAHLEANNTCELCWIFSCPVDNNRNKGEIHSYKNGPTDVVTCISIRFITRKNPIHPDSDH